ncbi:hypothetical protein BJY01DRAFT_237390 [Aspergillus pseudoustus]|uniref:GPI anchored serine-threonine rich protein n=1 Tax=Aspergillus pseudoustus TaxID=1810923 RepID=A0ABR4JF10_9EURO
MYTAALLFASLLAAPALASPDQKLAPFTGLGLSKRQGGDSFQPGTIPSSCEGWPFCGTSGICYNPDRGDTCCPTGTWACPGGTFCLQDGYCCPDGLDPQSCADELGVTLTSSDPEPTTTSSSSSSSTPVIPTYTNPTTTVTPPPASSSSAIPPTGSEIPPEFTGAANAHVVGGAAAVLGGLGVIGNLLI